MWKKTKQATGKVHTMSYVCHGPWYPVCPMNNSASLNNAYLLLLFAFLKHEEDLINVWKTVIFYHVNYYLPEDFCFMWIHFKWMAKLKKGTHLEDSKYFKTFPRTHSEIARMNLFRFPRKKPKI